MTSSAYINIARDYSRKIRAGEYRPGHRLPSYSDIGQKYQVSEITVRQALQLLQAQGLAYSRRRKGMFVAENLQLVRVSPERQLESAEQTFDAESVGATQIDRESAEIPATKEVAFSLELREGDTVRHTVTRASEDGHPISISDTYQPLAVANASSADFLEETLQDDIPSPAHAEWLGRSEGELVKVIKQRFTRDGVPVMISTVAYPRDRYNSFTFRMKLEND